MASTGYYRPLLSDTMILFRRIHSQTQLVKLELLFLLSTQQTTHIGLAELGKQRSLSFHLREEQPVLPGV